MDHLKLIQILIKDLDEKNFKLKTVKFFRKNIISFWIWLLVLENHYNNNNTNIENIIQIIPKELGSRPTFFEIINTAVAKKYFIKELDNKDKRKFNIIPSEQTIKEFEKWALIYKGIN